jgi:pimeloyl-ACP methyl ester carboxylesterase
LAFWLPFTSCEGLIVCLLLTSSAVLEFAQRIATSRAVLIERAGHLPHLERAAETARLVRDFVSG